MDKDIKIQLLDEVIRNRRSIYPPMYTNDPISDEELEAILENARWAPTHRKTEPWRFKIFRKEARNKLSEFLVNHYLENTPETSFSEQKLKRTKEKALRSDTVIAIIMARDPLESVPEWEEISSVAMAVQNMWLSCVVRGIGAYWSSPSSIINARDFLDLGKGERCLGLFYMGKMENIDMKSPRKPVSEMVEFI